MNKDFLIEGIGNIDFDIIDEAENYRPIRRSRAWIWASASAACLLIAGVLVFPHLIDSNNSIADNSGSVQGAGEASGENSDYNKIDEKVSVSITDDLQYILKDYKPVPEHKFYVRVYDANGAHSEVVWDTCLEPLGLTSDDKENFLKIGVASLTREQINTVKSSAQLNVVMDYGGEVEVTEEYLKTVNGPLKVWVFTNLGLDEALVGHEGEERISFAEEYIDEHFSEYEKDHGLNREEFEYFGIFTGTFTAELDKEKVAELLADKRSASISVSPESEEPLIDF